MTLCAILSIWSSVDTIEVSHSDYCKNEGQVEILFFFFVIQQTFQLLKSSVYHAVLSKYHLQNLD